MKTSYSRDFNQVPENGGRGSPIHLHVGLKKGITCMHAYIHT